MTTNEETPRGESGGSREAIDAVGATAANATVPRAAHTTGGAA